MIQRCTRNMMYGPCSVSHSCIIQETSCYFQSGLSSGVSDPRTFYTQHISLVNPLRCFWLDLQAQHPASLCCPDTCNGSVIRQYIWPWLCNPLGYLTLVLWYIPGYATTTMTMTTTWLVGLATPGSSVTLLMLVLAVLSKWVISNTIIGVRIQNNQQ